MTDTWPCAPCRPPSSRDPRGSGAGHRQHLFGRVESGDADATLIPDDLPSEEWEKKALRREIPVGGAKHTLARHERHDDRLARCFTDELAVMRLAVEAHELVPAIIGGAHARIGESSHRAGFPSRRAEKCAALVIGEATTLGKPPQDGQLPR